jgi:hypothetical protein
VLGFEGTPVYVHQVVHIVRHRDDWGRESRIHRPEDDEGD